MWHHPDDVHSTKILVPLGSEISFAGWCTCTHVFVYFVVLLFHQSIRQLLQRNSGQDRGDSQSSALFIDKACIHQTDEQRKKVGVKCIGAFLSRRDLDVHVHGGVFEAQPCGRCGGIHLRKFAFRLRSDDADMFLAWCMVLKRR